MVYIIASSHGDPDVTCGAKIGATKDDRAGRAGHPGAAGSAASRLSELLEGELELNCQCRAHESLKTNLKMDGPRPGHWQF